LAGFWRGAPPRARLSLTVVGTAGRNNRFLAAGVVALAALAAAFAAAFVGPALRRLLGVLPGFRGKFGARDAAPGVQPRRCLVLAPLLAVIVEAAVFMLVWRTRAPLRKDMLAARATWAACLSGLLPFLLAWASARLARVRWWQAALVACDSVRRSGRVSRSIALGAGLSVPALDVGGGGCWGCRRNRAVVVALAHACSRPTVESCARCRFADSCLDVGISPHRSTNPRAKRLRRGLGWLASCSRLASA
jgi:hypothetical protein